MWSFIIEGNLLRGACSPSCGGIPSRSTKIDEVVLAGKVGTVSFKRGAHIVVDFARVGVVIEF